jgi:hypothetical protein
VLKLILENERPQDDYFNYCFDVYADLRFTWFFFLTFCDFTWFFPLVLVGGGVTPPHTPPVATSLIRMFHCLFIVLKIPLFSMPSSHDSVIRMFHCLSIVVKILFSSHALIQIFKIISQKAVVNFVKFISFLKIFTENTFLSSWLNHQQSLLCDRCHNWSVVHLREDQPANTGGNLN